MRKAKVLVLHHTLNTAGGGERVCMHLLKLLCDMLDLNVTLGCTEPPDWGFIERTLGVRIERKPKVISLLPFKLRAFGIYHRPLTSVHVVLTKHDLVINTHGDATLAPADIVYLHFPVLAYMEFRYLRPYLKYYRSLFWRVYFEPYRQLQERFARRVFNNSKVILTNSKFSKMFIREVIGKDSIVIYPPVEIDEYLFFRHANHREDSVIYIARFSPEKNHHLIPYIARELPHVKFYVVGNVAGKGYAYYVYVKRLCEKLGVKNVVLLPNLPHRDKVKLLARCKVYLHLMVTEHFGIAPVEAMAAGLALVVPRLSGTWTDVCDFGRYGLGYARLDVSEIVPLIEDAMSRWRSLQAPVEHVMRFSTQNFYKAMQHIVLKFVDAAY